MMVVNVTMSMMLIIMGLLMETTVKCTITIQIEKNKNLKFKFFCHKCQQSVYIAENTCNIVNIILWKQFRKYV